MERKGRTTIRKQRRSRSWLFSPIIIAQLAVVMVVAGVGVAFALPQNPISQNADPWAGTGSIQQSANYEVDGYELMYDSLLANVTGVNLTIDQIGSGSAEINLVAINNSTGMIGSNNSVVVSADGTVPVTFSPVSIQSIDKINVILTDQ